MFLIFRAQRHSVREPLFYAVSFEAIILPYLKTINSNYSTYWRIIRVPACTEFNGPRPIYTVTIIPVISCFRLRNIFKCRTQRALIYIRFGSLSEERNFVFAC
jgi:hypothetical protein